MAPWESLWQTSRIDHKTQRQSGSLYPWIRRQPPDMEKIQEDDTGSD